MLVSDIVRRNAVYYQDHDAVVVPGVRTLSWADLEARSNQLARVFRDLGIQKGDRIAITSPNCAEFLEFYFACSKSGAIGAPTNIRLTAADLGSYLRLVEPRAVVAHASAADLVRQYLAYVPSIETVIGVGEGHGFELDYEVLVSAQPATDLAVDVAEDDIYQLGATSGTTGIPKAAILTHRNAIAGMMNWMAEMHIEDASTALQCIPMFFNPGGPSGLHPALMKGGRTVIYQAFDPGTFLRAVPEYRVRYSILVPTMIVMVLAHPECGQHDLSSLRAILCGGSPVPRELLIRGKKVFGDVFFPHFGLAETYSSGMVLRPECQFTQGTEEQVQRLASAGKPGVLMQVRVVADDGSDVARDNVTPGEIWLRGDSVSRGYFRMPEETKASREGEWFKTGDIAVVDGDAYITIIDRKKDIIITGGINVYSRDVEEVLSQHPAVVQAAVIGIPDKVWGEAVHAIVQLRPGAEPSPEELMAFAAERLASYKKPRSLEIVSTMPIGGTGKILKAELRAKYWAGRERRVG